MKFFAFRGVGVIALTVVVSATGLPQSKKNSKHDQQHTTTQQPDPNQNQSDSTFLTNALEANSAEVDLARIAQTKSQNPQVRQFADMIVQDHTEAIDRIRKAMNNGTTDQAAPVQLSLEHRQMVTKLSKLSGSAFDREFVNLMVQDHRRDVHNFEMMAATPTTVASLTPDSTITRDKPADDTAADTPADTAADTPIPVSADDAQTLAKDMLPILRSHLTQAETLQHTIKK